MSFTGAEDLGIKKRFLQRLRVFVSGRSEERLVRPMAVVESPGDRYFVADPGVRGVHLFDLRRGRYRLIRRENGDPLPSPVGLAAGLVGEVYVVDSRLAALYMIEPRGEVALKVPLDALISQPTGVALDKPSGRIYLVDTGSHEVKIFARDGALLRRVGGRGIGAGKFNYPTMIWMTDAGEFLVSDSLNFRTQVFDAEGNFLRQFGAAGDSAGFQPQSKGIATDSHGHVYVVDSTLHAVQIFDSSGTFLYRLGLRGDGAGEFLLPTGIFIGERDTIYVADSYNSRIQVFRYTGGVAQ
jgi:DNA-binding beta-propeller fold protein YncE